MERQDAEYIVKMELAGPTVDQEIIERDGDFAVRFIKPGTDQNLVFWDAKLYAEFAQMFLKIIMAHPLQIPVIDGRRMIWALDDSAGLHDDAGWWFRENQGKGVELEPVS